MLAQYFKDRIEMCSKNVSFTPPHTHTPHGSDVSSSGTLAASFPPLLRRHPCPGNTMQLRGRERWQGPTWVPQRGGRTFLRKGSTDTSFHQLLASEDSCREGKETTLSFRRRRQRLVARVSQPRTFSSSIKLRFISDKAKARGQDPLRARRCPEGIPWDPGLGYPLDASASRNHGSKKQQANDSYIFTLHNGNQLDSPDQTFRLK